MGILPFAPSGPAALPLSASASCLRVKTAALNHSAISPNFFRTQHPFALSVAQRSRRAVLRLRPFGPTLRTNGWRCRVAILSGTFRR
jgi:hypothetical protein